MADDAFKPTEQELEFLKSKRLADEASKVDIDLIKPGMTKDDTARVKAKIAEVWRR